MVIFEAKLARYHRECDALVREYYASTIASQGMTKLDFAWPTYLLLEQERRTLLMVAIDGADLVGFVLYHIFPHLHHKDEWLFGQSDMIGVRPSHRGKGIGRELVKRAELELRGRGCTHMVHQHRLIYPDKPLFERLGFKPVEVSYMKELN
jgi:GNAT superfamily N-acetyltransferase